MPTTNFNVGETVYVEVSTGTDALVQNKSIDDVRLVFDVSLPTPATTLFHSLGPNEVIQKINGVPAGNIYVKGTRVGSTGDIAVSE